MRCSHHSLDFCFLDRGWGPTCYLCGSKPGKVCLCNGTECSENRAALIGLLVSLNLLENF